MKKSFLFLQGPHGPFFSQLGHDLLNRGHRVVRVNFNGGDYLDWHRKVDVVRYTGDLHQWESDCHDLFHNKVITDLVLYSDCRPLHRVAIRLARDRGLRIHVFEEGYIRPDWITLENDGVNGNSSLPRDSAGYLQEQPESLGESHGEVGPSMRQQVGYCIKYNLASILLKPFFPFYRYHRQIHPAREAWKWIKRYPRMRSEKKRSRNIEESLLLQKQPYFLACLQVSVDSQVTCHSPFCNMEEFVTTVLDSFVKHAHAESSLVFKGHPLDPDTNHYRQLIGRMSVVRGLEGRCHYLEAGQLPPLIKEAQGVVLINSTVGSSVLFHNRPLIALGESIYNFDGLTFQGGLDAFWRNPQLPDRAVSIGFRRHLLNSVLINGGFYNATARKQLLAKVVAKLESSKQMANPLALDDSTASAKDKNEIKLGLLDEVIAPECPAKSPFRLPDFQNE